MSKKRPAEPRWWMNTFFLFGFALFVLAIWGLVKGEDVIRDPGQIFETGLVWLYLGGSVLMLANGWMTHQQAVQQYSEFLEQHGDDADGVSKKGDNEVKA